MTEPGQSGRPAALAAAGPDLVSDLSFPESVKITVRICCFRFISVREDKFSSRLVRGSQVNSLAAFFSFQIDPFDAVFL